MELQRQESLPGFRGMGNKLKEVDKQILCDSDNPLGRTEGRGLRLIGAELRWT